MGQRHMTYIYVYDENGVEAVGCLYNQWNHAPIQPPKIIRFEKQLTRWRRNKIRYTYEYSKWVKMYECIATVSDDTMDIRYHDEFKEYNENYGMYDEDNNDGWQFLVIKIDSKKNYKPVKVTHGFKPSSGGKFLNLFDNILLDDTRVKDEYKLHKIENYLKDYSKTDQKILHRINDSFDVEILRKAEMKIKMLIQKKVSAA